MKLTTKVSFELREDGKAKVELEGSNVVIKSGLLTIIERLAELEGRSVSNLLSELTEIAKMKEETPFGAILMDILDDLFGEDGEEYEDEETCDGNCENCSTHDEMPLELKAVFDKMFGGEK